MIKKDHEEIWYWYQCMEDFKNSEMGQKEYCTANSIDYKKFCNMRFRIVYRRYQDPEFYFKLVDKGREYIKSGILGSTFAKENNIKRNHLTEILTHINYLDIIEKMKEQKEGTMAFIQAPKVVSKQVLQAEVIEKQNDIELIISKGVKVIVAPEISTDKLIKIIELLKDL